MAVERILGTETGKSAFEKTDRNVVALDTALGEHKVESTAHGINLKASKNSISNYYLVLQNGFTGSGRADKNDLAQIYFRGLIVPGSTITKGTVIATLPVEYRPAQHLPIFFIRNNVIYQGASINKDTGNIILNNDIEAGYGLYFTTVYQI